MKNKSPTVISHSKNSDTSLRHAHVFSPASRAYFAWLDGKLDSGQLNQRESGKFFPAVAMGLNDTYAPEDVQNGKPPEDGKIASANQGNGEFMDEPGTHWQKHDVLSGDILKVSWNYSQKHRSRRWNYFVTRTDWNPNLPLSRAQFEDTPFFQVQLHEQPYWSVGEALTPPDPTLHDVMLPNRAGYHVLLAIWEVADTPNAFYHVIDLNFVGEGANDKPLPPAAVRVTGTTNNSASLAWNTATSSVAHYQIYRDSSFLAKTTTLSWTDSNLLAGTTYQYAVSTVNTEGVESTLSNSVSALTLSDNSNELPPSAPTSLHSMGKTEDSVSLMWGSSTSTSGLKSYLIYREGLKITEVPLSSLSFNDTGLLSETTYRYFVVAEDIYGRLSVPSNVLSVTTDVQSGGGSTYPAWVLGTFYPTGTKVSHRSKDWICLQAHTAHVEEWAPGTAGAESLWLQI